MRLAIEQLDGDNQRAWQLFETLCSRFLTETQALPAVLMRLTAEDDAEDLTDRMTRLSIIYDIRCPPPKKETS